VGRRIELIDAFRRAGERLGVALRIHGADVVRTAPAMHHVDVAHLVPPIADPAYVSELSRIVARHRIDLLIPTLDPDLPVLARATDRLAEAGCRVVISTPEVVNICRDKLRTFDLLRRAKIDTPRTWDVAALDRRARSGAGSEPRASARAEWASSTSLPIAHGDGGLHQIAPPNRVQRGGRRDALPFPLFMKPRFGSAAVGNYKIFDRDDLVTLARRVPEPIVQEFVDGVEHTLDVYCGFDGVPRCVVPRRRLEVRTGEVSKALTIKDPTIMEVGRRVAEALGGCRGVVTVQCMVTRDRRHGDVGRVRVIEINPRFGGGAPLAIRAGADFPRWILEEHLGRHPRIRFDGFRDKLAMLRYDQSVFVSGRGMR